MVKFSDNEKVDRWQLWHGDEGAVEMLNFGWHSVGLDERPNIGDRKIRSDRRPIREGQAWIGLQCHKKIWRGIDGDGRVGARSGDPGKHGGPPELTNCRHLL